MAKRQRRRRQERRHEHSRRTGWQTRHSVITGAGLAAGAALGMTGVAQAAYLYVGDGGDTTHVTPNCTTYGNTTCSLRDAVATANTNSDFDYIYFESGISGTITLGSPLAVTNPVGIYGPGPKDLTVSGGHATRIFDVNPDTAGDLFSVTGLTLANGQVTGDGAAIKNDDATLRVFDAVLSGNTATGQGGAVYEAGNYYNGRYDIFGFTTFKGNHAADGGALYAYSGWGILGATTFNGNVATGYGGAVDGGGGYMYDSTVAGNIAAGDVGGVFAYSIGVYNTILANNSGSGAPDLAASSGYAGFDLVRTPGTTSISGSTIITGQDPQLGSLQDNGGDTPTLKAAAGSPVVDQGYSGGYYDQRFMPRIVDNPHRANNALGNGADIGAVELTLAEGPQAVPTPPPPGGGTLGGHKKCKKKKHKSSAQIAKKRCKKKKKRHSAARIASSERTGNPQRSAGLTFDGRARHAQRAWPDDVFRDGARWRNALREGG